MKTQFYSLLQVKKQELEKKEMEIAHINLKISQKLDEITQFQIQMKEFLTPSSGTFQDFKMLQEHKNAFLFQIDSMHLEISHLKQERSQLEKLYQEAFIEYEKINYLHNTEQKKQLEKLKKNQEKQLDEIALTLFELNKEKI
ncbi:hypothetical protein CQA57_03835 [Helicobacter anseris]|uniref:Flagellar FliJ protein n=1 Tax=Helicobacter anseris TaxID=375926 RepID=A0A3D8J9I5_9HELI|nr:flagellar export protein FliJ [Helicobacter anseris]RDU73950.1 hypothetical protein CQA57_03835 [Helicobacter anseris]